MDRTSFLKKLSSTLFLSSICPLSAQTQKDETTDFLEKTKMPSFEFVNATFDEVVEFLRLRSIELDPKEKGLNFHFLGSYEKVEKVTITKMSEHAMTYKALLDVIAKESRYSYSQRFGGIVFAPKNHPLTPTPKADKINPKSLADLQKTIIPQLSFKNSTLSEVAMFLTLRIESLNLKGGNLEFKITPDLEKKNPVIESYSARNVTLDHILNYLCQQCGLDYEIQDRKIIISASRRSAD